MPISSLLRADVELALGDPVIDWDGLRGCTILVTGATGVVGRHMLRSLALANAERDLGLRLVAQARSASTLRDVAEECGATPIMGDLRSPDVLEPLRALDHVVHCAAVTASAQIVARPADVITTTVLGTQNVLERARALGCRSVVYLSSMEVYGQGLTGDVTETELGSLDLSSPRTSYPESKRLAEALCVAYAAQFGLDVIIARPGLTFGAGVPDDAANNRAPMQFARAALAGQDIVLRTDGTSVTNCCDTADLTRALLILLSRGTSGAAYNIANPAASMSIRELAQVAADALAGGRIDVVVDLPADAAALGYAPPSGYRLNVDRLAALGWVPRHGAAEMFRRMVAGWQEARS